MSRPRALIWAAFACAAATLTFGLARSADAIGSCSISWTAGGDGAWSEAGRWSENRVPSSGDTVCLPTLAAPYTVRISGIESVTALVIDPTATLAIRPPYNTTAALTVAGESVNAGAIVLDQTDRYSSAALTISGETLTNTGSLTTAHGSADCCAGGRSISGTIVNSGVVSVAWGTTYAGSLSNSGSVTVASGQTLTFTAGSTFTQAAGSVHVDGAMAINGSTLAFTGGSFTGNAPNVGAGTVAFSGAAPRSGEVRAHGANTLTGDVPSGVTVRLRTGYQETSTLSVPASITNAGALILDAADRYGSSALAIAAGQLLTNTGTLLTQNGPADCCSPARTITGDITSPGAFEVTHQTTYTGDLVNSGTMTVSGALTFSGVESSLTQSSGALSIPGSLLVAGGTLTFSAGDLTGNPPLVGAGSIALPGTGARTGEVGAYGVNGLSGNIPAGVTVRLRARYQEPASLTLLGDAANDGTLITEAGDRYGPTTLAVPPGATLTNNGILRSAHGPADCCTGLRKLTGNIDNAGTMAIDTSTTLEGRIRNSGAMSVATGQTLTITGAGSALHQLAGTLAVPGVIVQDAGTFRHAGGAMTGTPVQLVGIGLEFPASALSRSGEFRVRGAAPTISGDIPVGVTVNVRSAYQEAVILTAAGSFTNAGTLLLDHDGRYGAVTLSVPGTLTNAGTLRSQMGPADCCVYNRTFTGNLVNTGVIEVARDLVLDTQDGSYTSSGSITTLPGASLIVNGKSQVVEVTAGTLDVQGALNLSGTTFRYLGGTLTGTELSLRDVDVQFGSAAAALPFVMSGASTLTGDIPAGQVLAVRAGYQETASLRTTGASTNAGTIRLEANNRYATTNLDATAGTFTNTGTLVSQLGTADCCQARSVTAPLLVNSGTFTVALPTGFVGTLRNTGVLDVLAAGSLSVNGASSRLEQNAGTLTAAGSVGVQGGTVSFGGGTVSGSPYLANGTVSFPASSTAVGQFRTLGVTAMTGDVPPGARILVRSPYNDTATLVPAAAFTNSGTIVLDHESRYGRSVLNLAAGPMTNAGLLEGRLGPADCCQYGQFVNGRVLNAGTIRTSSYLEIASLANNGNLDVVAGELRALALDNWDATTATLTGGSATVANAAAFRFAGTPIAQNASALTLAGSGGVTNLGGGDLLTALNGSSGALTLAGGKQLTVPAFANTGTVAIRDGSRLTSTGTYTQSTAGAVTSVVDTSPEIVPDEDLTTTTARLVAGGSGVQVDGGLLGGNGLVTGNVVNAGGVVDPGTTSVGTLTLGAAYTQLDGGALDLAVATPTDRDRLAVTGSAALAGALVLHPGEGYLPVGADSVPVLSAASVSGTFSSVTGSALSGGWIFEPAYDAAAVRLDVTERVAPTNPTVTSPSHSISVWSSASTVQLAMSGAADNLSGLAGHSYSWSGDAGTAPDTSVDAISLESLSSPTLPEGESWFHLRTLDGEGNWSAATHVGPFRIDTVAPAVPTGTSASHAGGQWHADQTVDVALGGAADVTSGVATWVYAWSTDAAVVPDTTETAPASAAAQTSPTLPSGLHYLHVWAVDGAGNAGPVAHLGPFGIDTIAPAGLTGSSASHPAGQWRRDRTIDVVLGGGADEHSGVATYEYGWTVDTVPPDTMASAAASSATLTSPPQADGIRYLHVRAVDRAGNPGELSTFGPFRIDTTGPAVPTGSSVSHPVGVWRKDATVDVALAGAADQHSGVASWVYAWSTSATTVPVTRFTAPAPLSSRTSPALASGLQYLHIWAVDAAGNAGVVGHLGPYRVDVTPPSAAALATPTTTAPFTITWSTTAKVPVVRATWSAASDAHSGVGGYRVAYRSAPSSTATFGAVAYSPLTTARSWSTNGAVGRTYCLRVETRDKVGNIAAVSAERCVTTPIDDVGLTASKTATGVLHWTKPASSGSYFGTVSSSTTLGATMKSGTVKFRRLALVVDKCTTCGSVQVYLGSTLLGTYSLAGSGTHVVVPVRTWTTTQTGVITIKISTTGKPVKIDALGVAAL